MGHHLIMGRLTFESIGRALPGRTTIVLTRCPAKVEAPDGVLLAADLDAALALAAGDDEVFIAGGAEVYRLALERADRLYLTRVHLDVDGDRFFPAFDEASWRLVSREDHPPGGRDPLGHSFFVLERPGCAGGLYEPRRPERPGSGCPTSESCDSTRKPTATPGPSGGAAPR